MTKIYPTYESKEFDGVVIEENGRKRVKILHPQYFQYEVNKFSIGEQITTKLTNKKRKRTQRQNNYYHLYLSLVALSSGNSQKALHTWARGKFLSQGITEVYGDKTRMVKSTTELTVLEFIEYIERIAETTTVPLPDPAPFKIAITHKEWETLKQEQKVKYLRYKPLIKSLT